MVIIDVGGERHSAERNCLLRYPTTRYDWGIDHFVQMIEEMRIDNAFMQIIEIDHQTAGKWKNTTEGNGLFSFLVSTFNHLAQRPKKSELYGWQLSTRKNFPDKVRKSFSRKNA